MSTVHIIAQEEKGMQYQWKSLILDPLRNITCNRNGPLCIVVDALDECEDDDVRLVLRLLSQAASLETVRLNIFITSRPEAQTRLGFKEISEKHQVCKLHEIQISTIQKDIKTFLVHELGKIQENLDMDTKWPDEEKIDFLCTRARGLFIYASTACLYIADPDQLPEDSLYEILEDDYVGQSATEDLDNMYGIILAKAMRFKAKNEKTLIDQFRQIVGSILVLYESLSATVLAGLLEFKPKLITARLRSLHSVLDIPEEQSSPIRLKVIRTGKD